MYKITLEHTIKHFKTICKHKYYVAKYCFRFSLYWQGLTHDLSKFSFKEFWTSVKYYQGNRSPIDAEKEDKGYSYAWLHHWHTNKHHWIHWIDFDMKQNLTPYKIPYKYVIESICDWIGAGKAYNGNNFNWAEPYEYYRDHTRINEEISSKIFHPKTRYLFDTILIDIKDKGIDKVIKYHKTGIYKKIYDSDEEFNKEMIQADYTRILDIYYKTKEEKIKEFEHDIYRIKDMIVDFRTSVIDYFLVKPSFYEYLQAENWLKLKKGENGKPISYFYDLGSYEIKIEKDLKENFKPIYKEDNKNG